MIPLHFYGCYGGPEEEVEAKPPKPRLLDVHSHCWCCDGVVWGQQTEIERKKRESVLFHCDNCDVRQREVSCRCRVKKRILLPS